MKTVVSFGETLWDLLPTGPVLGGAPCNLAFRINSLGERGVVVTRLGRDELGRKAFDLLAGQGMETRFIQWDDAHATGTVPVKVDAKGVPDFTILKDVAYDFIEPGDELQALASSADCICFGSLGQRSPATRQTLMKVLSAAPRALKFFDINLRKDCYGASVVEQSLFKSDILKLNDGEALELRRMFNLSAQAPEDIAREVRSRWGLQACVVTLGEHGAFALTAKEEVRVKGAKVTVVDTIGSGDAFSAGFLTSWLRGETLAQCAALGNALGALVAGTKGGMAPISRDDINRFCGRSI